MSEDIDKFYKDYFKDKFHAYGDTPKGVDWKDEDAQVYSFQYIMDAIRLHHPSLDHFSILEVGCGYGAFFEFLKQRGLHGSVEYFGIDLVEEMIEKAAGTYPKIRDNFYAGDFKTFQFKKKFDFIASSGIFNLKEQIDETVFEQHVLRTIELMFHMSEKGTVFNLMTPAPDFKNPKLFYPSLDVFFSFMYKKLSRKITIISSYPLWKITIGIFK